MDPGVGKVGKVRQASIQRTLRNGNNIVLLLRRPLPHERHEEFDARCKVQWHQVCVYPEKFVPITVSNQGSNAPMTLNS
jgi:hypothetical protein